MKKKLKVFLIVVVAFIGFGALVMALWNAILPEVIGVKEVTFLQALGILLLSKILFGGFRGGGGWAQQRREKWLKMQDKMASMTPEEKEKFKNEWRNRCRTGWNRNQEADKKVE